MPAVCVLGGGHAGTEAAREAARCGAQVTVFERCSNEPVPRRAWPSLLRGGPPATRGRLLRVPGVEVLLGTPAASVGPGRRVYADRSSARFDSLVIATGSRPAAATFPGWRKHGVRVLGSSSDYLELAAYRDDLAKCVVAGGGAGFLEVADGISGGGRRLTVLGRFQSPGGVCGPVAELLEMSAAGRGVKVVPSRLARAVGDRRLEAVVTGEKVVPCDSLVVVPPFRPDPPPGSPAGPHGGVKVDEAMRTSERGVYAAGSCAEMEEPAGPLLRMGRSGAAAGRAAGANSAGREVRVRAAGAFSLKAFGICVEGAGLTYEAASKAGLKVVETVGLEGPSAVCSIVHEGLTGRVVGAQLAGKEAEGLSGTIALAVSLRLNLMALAYSDIGSSTDISLLQDTARQALRRS